MGGPRTSVQAGGVVQVRCGPRQGCINSLAPALGGPGSGVPAMTRKAPSEGGGGYRGGAEARSARGRGAGGGTRTGGGRWAGSHGKG